MVNNSNFRPETGARLVTDRRDFQSHLDGQNPAGKTGFRHNSSQIDISPSIGSLGGPTTLNDALNTIGNFINSQIGIGQGFITIGDGYDTWVNADPDNGIFYDPTIPGLDEILNPIFQSILDNGLGTGSEVSPLPAQYERIKRGGIIVIKAGTYIVKNTIVVPPGITIMGEGYGTKIINATSLTLSPLPPQPKISPTSAPVFTVKADNYRTINDSAINSNTFMFGRRTIFYNLVISDNFVENTILGDTFYKIPQNRTGNTPLIQQEQGSNLVIDNVYLMGRVTFSSGQIVSQATTFAVQLDGYSPLPTGTFLKINNCFIDGFSVPIDYQTSGGSNDSLEIVNNKIRGFGYLTGDNAGPENNCLIKMNDNNAVITDNYLYGNSNIVTSAVFINSVIGSSVNTQAQSKIVIANNDVVIDKSQNSTNSTYRHYRINGSISNITSKVFSLIFGNTFQSTSGFDIYVNNSSTTPDMSLKDAVATFGKSTNSNTNIIGATIGITSTNTNITGITGITGNTTITGTTNMIGNTTITGVSALNGNTSIIGSSIDLTGAVTAVGATYLNGTLRYKTFFNDSSATYSVGSDGVVFIMDPETLGADITITLPLSTTYPNRLIIIKNASSFPIGSGTKNLYIAITGSDKLEGVSSPALAGRVMPPLSSWSFISNSTTWHII